MVTTIFEFCFVFLFVISLHSICCIHNSWFCLRFASFFQSPISLQGTFPSSAMSFVFYSAMGVGGIDSRGSIQQPIVDRQVVSIGYSYLEETCYEASDSESFSPERLVESCHVGWGTSCLCRGGKAFYYSSRRRACHRYHNSSPFCFWGKGKERQQRC